MVTFDDDCAETVTRTPGHNDWIKHTNVGNKYCIDFAKVVIEKDDCVQAAASKSSHTITVVDVQCSFQSRG
eukprot:1160532-Pelagomonas_calceolata.AAC.15